MLRPYCFHDMKSNLKPFILFFTIFYIIWILRATFFYSAVDLAIADGTQRLIFVNIVEFILWVIPAAVFIVHVDQQNLLATMKVTTTPDRRGLLQAALISTLYFIIVFLAERYLISGRTLHPLLVASPLLILTRLAQVFFSPITEELFFRGFVLPKLNECYSFWLANIIQTLLFTAMHLPNWLWVNGFQTRIIASAIGIFIIGMLFGWLMRRTNSIWPPVMVHILKNFLVSFLG